ncbi:MAG: hypothetical protein HY902_07075 [Deltaproteobacteria bacterium]|nr:hypothetical protein [Deltaproteobacteria bacterium]
MSEAIILLVGGTKVLERELQNAANLPLISVATMEEGVKIMTEKPTAAIILGPTLRRALAMVSTLRREGQSEPKLMVVYRDDQRDEVKRHQRGKSVADSYIAQSRIQREVGPGLRELLAQSQITQLQPEDFASDNSTQMLDLATIEIEEEELPPTPPVEMVGELDEAALEPIEELTDELTEDLTEELTDGEMVEEVLQEVGDDLIEDLEPDDGGALEELVALDAVEELTDLVPTSEVEALESADLVEEITDTVEQIADLDAIEFDDDLELPAQAVEPTRASTEEVTALVAGLREMPELLPAEGAAAVEPAPEPESAPAPEPGLAAEPAPAPVAVAAAVAPPQPEPAAVEPPRPAPRAPSGAHHQMFSELAGFMERLQTAASDISRLETENSQLRAELAEAQSQAAAAARSAAVVSEIEQLQVQLRDVQTRLVGSEEARNAAVEARMRAEQAQVAQAEELAKLRAELSALQAHVSSTEAQLDARRRISADSVKTLRAIASLLES